jgi:hypothetical protein
MPCFQAIKSWDHTGYRGVHTVTPRWCAKWCASSSE